MLPPLCGTPTGRRVLNQHDTDGDPLHNALAERMNGIIKNLWMLSDEKRSFARAEALVEQDVCMYCTMKRGFINL